MSFADTLRQELLALPVKKNCCRRALCAGALLVAERQGAQAVMLKCRFEATVPLIKSALETVFAKEVNSEILAYHGHRATVLTVASPACARLVSHLQSEGADVDAILKLSACEGCRSAFLRGAFLCMGSMNDPQKSSHLEFSVAGGRAESALSSFLADAGYPPRRIARASGCGL